MLTFKDNYYKIIFFRRKLYLELFYFKIYKFKITSAMWIFKSANHVIIWILNEAISVTNN